MDNDIDFMKSLSHHLETHLEVSTWARVLQGEKTYEVKTFKVYVYLCFGHIYSNGLEYRMDFRAYT